MVNHSLSNFHFELPATFVPRDQKVSGHTKYAINATNVDTKPANFKIHQKNKEKDAHNLTNLRQVKAKNAKI